MILPTWRLLPVALLSTFAPRVATAQLFINEFVASNATGITDESGAHEDWIEIYNAGAAPVDLAGYYLSDDPTRPRLWRIPTGSTAQTTIAAQAYLVFWADKDVTTGANHVDFKLSAGGETIVLTAPDGATTVDAYTFGAQFVDVSFGRVGDGGQAWDFFATPTPRAANTTAPGTPTVAPPTVSPRGGLYASTVTVALSVPNEGAQIRYTTDGSVPTPSSTLYGAPLTLSQNTPLRVRAFRAGLTASQVVTETYLFGASHTTSVVAYTADPVELFSPATGMYPNFDKDIEIEANAELFEPDGTRGFNQLFGSELQGTGSVSYPQKSLALKAKKSLGASVIPYRVFPANERDEYRSLTLRNSGQDNTTTLFRDVLATSLVLDLSDVNVGALRSITKPDVNALRYRPNVAYVNGAYWGLLNLRERADARYIETHFGLEDDEIDFLENDAEVREGDIEAWAELQAYLGANRLADEAAYRYVADRVDIGNLIDHYALEIYIDNRDWPQNNTRRFRERAEGGQWRWLTFDLDLSMGLLSEDQVWNSGYNRANSLRRLLETRGEADELPDRVTLLFRRLMENEGFRARFVNRVADQLNVLYLKQRVQRRIDELVALYRPEMAQHLERWAPGLPWEDNVGILRGFADGRDERVRQHFVGSVEGITGVHTVKVEVNDPAAGEVDFSTVTVHRGIAPFTGKYFGGVAIPVSAHPARGYVFESWAGAASGAASQRSVTLTGDATLRANFRLGSTAADAIVINEINYNSAPAAASDDWVELHNPNAAPVDISGWTFEDESGEFFPIPGATVIPAGGYLVLAEDSTAFAQVYPTVSGVVGGFGNGTRGFKLGNGGEGLTLRNAAGALIDEVRYDDEAPWPTAADGDGPTLQLRSAGLDNALPSSWDAAPATPGAVNGNSVAVSELERRVGLRLAPNPAAAEVRIEVNEGSDAAALTVYNAVGQRVRTLAGGSSTRYIVDVSGLADGLYTVELRLVSGERVARRLVVRR